MPIDKPVIAAQDAQKAAAIAKEAADYAEQAQAIANALPAGSTHDTAFKVLGGIATVGGIVATALTAGTVPAFIAGGVGLVTWIAGLLHTKP